MSAVDTQGLFCEITDGGADLLVLLHGLGATGDVWSPFREARPEWFRGRILIPDLPGHGGSSRLDDYSIPNVAQAVAEMLRSKAQRTQHCVILGHSFGGVVAVELANSRWDVAPRHVLGLGIKTLWTEDDLAFMARVAAKPSKTFASRTRPRPGFARPRGWPAWSRRAVIARRRGVVREDDGEWGLALDPKVNAVSEPMISQRIADAECPVSLAYGEGDRMIDAKDTRRHDPAAEALAGGGHNIMVTHPDVVWDWLSRKAGF